MKKIIKITAIALIASCLVNCGNQSLNKKAPSEVAVLFMENVKQKKFEKNKTLVDSSSPYLSDFGEFLGYDLFTKTFSVKFTVINEVINDDALKAKIFIKTDIVYEDSDHDSFVVSVDLSRKSTKENWLVYSANDID
jgi:hypothetical protein